MDQERRHDYSDISDRLGHLETQVSGMETRIAIIHERTESTQGIKKAVLANVAAIVVAVFAIGVSWSDLHAQLNNIDVGGIKKNLGSALSVLKDHGSEIAAVEQEQARIRGRMDSMIDRFHSTIEKRTDDRFRRRDFKAAEKFWEERFNRIEERIGVIEGQHEELFHRRRQKRNRGQYTDKTKDSDG